MKKILIVYATAGIGHKKASLAVKAALDEVNLQDAQISLIDALDYTNAFFKWTYLKAYLLMVNKFPLFWGFLYYMTDNFYVDLVVSRLRRFSNYFNSRPLALYLLKEKFDVIISTHFFATEVISDLKSNGHLKSQLINVVTDYRLHSWWVSDHVDMNVVAGESAREDLLRWKVPESKIKVLGIPAEPIFTKKLDKEKIYEKELLKKGMLTILVIGGGFGVGPIEEIIKVIGQIKEKVQTIAICGHNEELVKKLTALKDSTGADIKVIGFANNVYEYMEVSDILISKSGGITVTESLIKELPMIVISPIMGQETRNSDFLIANGAAVKVNEISELRGVLEDLVSSKEKIARMKEAIRRIAKPTACYDIGRLAVEMCNKE